MTVSAIPYLPKETLPELDELLTAIFRAHEQGEPPWKLLFERLNQYFDERFGPGWKDKEKSFWSEFELTYQIGKGIQERLMHDERVTRIRYMRKPFSTFEVITEIFDYQQAIAECS